MPILRRCQAVVQGQRLEPCDLHVILQDLTDLVLMEEKLGQMKPLERGEVLLYQVADTSFPSSRSDDGRLRESRRCLLEGLDTSHVNFA